jgi:hypothetical protein
MLIKEALHIHCRRKLTCKQIISPERLTSTYHCNSKPDMIAFISPNITYPYYGTKIKSLPRKQCMSLIAYTIHHLRNTLQRKKNGMNALGTKLRGHHSKSRSTTSHPPDNLLSRK